MNKYSVNVFWSDEDEAYIAISPEFSRLSTFGDTPEEAVAEMQVALELAVETYEKSGWPLPEPRAHSEYSGQFRLRLPRTLHAKLATQAQHEGVSLNTLAVTYLAEALGHRSAPGSAEPTSPGLLRVRPALAP